MSAAVVAHNGRGGASGPGFLRTLLRFPDFVLLGVALPVFLLVGWPLVGWVVAAAGWLLQAVIVGLMEQRAATSSEPRKQVGLVVGGWLVRAWLSAALILGAYLIDGNAAGLACALLMIACFTTYFTNKMITHVMNPTDGSRA